MEYGLVAAIGWGVSSVAATHAARRMGTLAALLASQATGTIVLTAVLAALHPHLLALPSTTVLGLAGAGFLSLLGWLTYYRALEYGPVGIVSGTAATYGGITALLAMVVLGEPLGRYGGIGDALAVAGVAAAAMQTSARPTTASWLQNSADSNRGRPSPGWPGQARARRKPWPGLLLALVSAATYGTGAFWLGMYAAAAGWLVSALMVDIISVTVLLAALICRQKRPHGGRGGAAWAVTAGLTEAAALVAFARGGQAGQVAVTAAVSSTYPVIPLAAGLVLFRERLSALQVSGICVAVAGLALVSMSTRLALAAIRPVSTGTAPRRTGARPRTRRPGPGSSGPTVTA
jgi:drug/metabolite transporter (DMT)-like permease